MRQILSFHLTCRNTSAAGVPRPTSDGGICLIPLIKEKGLLACHVQYIKGDQAPVCKSDDRRGDPPARVQLSRGCEEAALRMSHSLEVFISSGLGNNHAGVPGSSVFSEAKRFPKHPSVPSTEEFRPNWRTTVVREALQHLAIIFQSGISPAVQFRWI